MVDIELFYCKNCKDYYEASMDKGLRCFCSGKNHSKKIKDTINNVLNYDEEEKEISKKVYKEMNEDRQKEINKNLMVLFIVIFLYLIKEYLL